MDLKESDISDIIVKSCLTNASGSSLYVYMVWLPVRGPMVFTLGEKELDEMDESMSGSVAEFYITPLLQCFGDVDVMLRPDINLGSI